MISKIYTDTHGKDMKMVISPKSRKMASNVQHIFMELEATRQSHGKKVSKPSYLVSGFKFKEYVDKDDLKHNKKRMKNHKFIG